VQGRKEEYFVSDRLVKTGRGEKGRRKKKFLEEGRISGNRSRGE